MFSLFRVKARAAALDIGKRPAGLSELILRRRFGRMPGPQLFELPVFPAEKLEPLCQSSRCPTAARRNSIRP
jgi:hypothetical protein